jgi:hypothetical protein
LGWGGYKFFFYTIHYVLSLFSIVAFSFSWEDQSGVVYSQLADPLIIFNLCPAP